MRWLLDIRLRAATYFGLIVPIVLISPSGSARGSIEDFASPLGVVLLAVVFLIAGTALDERGGIRSIRGGAAARVAGAVLLVAAFTFAFEQSRTLRLERVEGWMWLVLVVLAVHVVYAAVDDIRTLIDPHRR